DELERTKELVQTTAVSVMPVDFLDGQALLPRIRELVKEGGRVYGLCHCAGVVETRPLTAFDAAAFRKMLDVNLVAGIELAQVAARRDIMREDGGAVLFIASIYAWVGMPGQVGYSATKGAVLAAARTMAVELARRRIRVNTLSPGLVRTPMSEAALSKLSADHIRELEQTHPLGTGVPEDVARVAAFLLAPQS